MSKMARLQEENDQLVQALAAEQDGAAALRSELTHKQQHITHLEELVRLLRQKQFGASSEKSPDQIPLFDEDPEAEEAPSEATPVRSHARRPRRPRIAADLPREDIIHDLDPSERICAEHGCELDPMGEETSEQVEFIPAKVRVLRHVCRKYTCPQCEGHVVTAKKPPQPIPGGMATPSLLSWVAVSKYADALPLYRQCEIFRRIGFEVDRTTLASWMIRSGQLLQPLVNLLRERLLAQPVVHMDETTVQVLAEQDRSKSHMWVSAAGPPGAKVVLFDYGPGRDAQVATDLLQDYSGTLMVDGYSGYDPVCTANGLVRLGCWAHARRKFADAQRLQSKGHTGKPDQALALIGRLYAVERELTEQDRLRASKELALLTPAERHSLRQEKSAPVLDELHAWLTKSLPREAPKTTLGKALQYLHNQWPRLIRYLEDGRYPIDNNRAENAVRPFTVGRRNWLFSQSVRGVKASANLYSLIETAKANGIEPMAYLMRAFEALPKATSLQDVEALLPEKVKDGG